MCVYVVEYVSCSAYSFTHPPIHSGTDWGPEGYARIFGYFVLQLYDNPRAIEFTVMGKWVGGWVDLSFPTVAEFCSVLITLSLPTPLPPPPPSGAKDEVEEEVEENESLAFVVEEAEGAAKASSSSSSSSHSLLKPQEDDIRSRLRGLQH